MHKFNKKYAFIENMEKRDLKDVIIDQKEELENLTKREKIIEREFFTIYKKQIDSDLVKVITGIRRCGKSVLSYQLLKHKNFAYINFDDERLVVLETKDLNTVLEVFYEVYGQFKFLLLDEVQNIRGWELFVNRLQRQGFNAVITGSNAKLLSKELATHLTGRHLALELFPFSFREFLDYYGFEINRKPLSTREKGIIKKKFNEYIQRGGFPEALKENTNSKAYLQALYSTIIDKDVVLRHKVKYVKTLKDISNYLLSNTASQVSFNKIKNVFNLKSIHTALNYLSFLEEAYIFFFLKRLSYKYKESLIANRKVYVIDPGFINALSFKFSHNLGKLYENLVAVELLRKKATKHIELYYWQDIYKHEVDFVIKHGLKINQLIQVCYNIKDYDTKKHEVRALVKASKELKCRNLLVITEDFEGEEIVERKKITYTPLWKWLLNH